MLRIQTTPWQIGLAVLLSFTVANTQPQLACGQTSAGAGSSWSDDFEDRVIDSSLWEWGGARRGIGGFGAGSWQWSHEEVVATDGYLRIRVWGPTSGNTFGGEAWVRTRYDYNDGSDHLINFTWEAVVSAYHIDSYAIQITDGDTAQGSGDLTWWLSDSACHKNLYCINKGWVSPGSPCFGEDPHNMPPSSWSIVINAEDQTATLYLGPNGTGNIHSQKTLDSNCPWHVRFFQMDATSAGFPAGDNRLNLYDFSSSPAGPAPDDCPSVCGNNIVEALEECDDGGNVDLDGCSSSCELEDEPDTDPAALLDAVFLGSHDLLTVSENEPLTLKYTVPCPLGPLSDHSPRTRLCAQLNLFHTYIATGIELWILADLPSERTLTGKITISPNNSPTIPPGSEFQFEICGSASRAGAFPILIDREVPINMSPPGPLVEVRVELRASGGDIRLPRVRVMAKGSELLQLLPVPR